MSKSRYSKPESGFGPENRLRELGWSLEEEKLWYNELLDRMIQNPRYYLDNLSNFEVYRVVFIQYRPYTDYIDGTIRIYNQ